MGSGESWSRIHEGSSEYTEQRLKKSRTIEPVFANSTTTCYRENQKLLERLDQGVRGYSITREEVLENLKNPFGYVRDDLRRFFQQEPERVQIFVEEILAHHPICDRIQNVLRLNNPLSAMDIKEAFEQNWFDNEFLAEILEFHKMAFEVKQREFFEFSDKIREEFRICGLAAIESGYLPISKEIFCARLAEQQFSLSDPLLTKSLGSNNQMWRVSMNEKLPNHKRKHALFHELVHAIAGQSLIIYGEGPFKKMERTKSGLLYQSPTEKRSLFVKSPLHWLNEAVTETIALHLSGEEDMGYYAIEREGLKRIIEAGVDITLFRKAYFEDQDPLTPRLERGVAVRDLFKTIKATLPPKGLQAMEEKVVGFKNMFN